jgi:hypothetical protein
MERITQLESLISQLLQENSYLKHRVQFMQETVNEKISQNCGFFCALPECPKSMERYAEQEPYSSGLTAPSESEGTAVRGLPCSGTQ